MNGNKDWEQNHQRWKYLQPDQTRLVNKEDSQKVHQGRKQSWLDETVNNAVRSEENQK